MKQTSLTTHILGATCLFASAASADIGFSAAVDASRAAVPQATLFGVEIRERNNVLVYEGDMYDTALTTNWDPRFNMDTGALIQTDVDSPDPSNISTLQWIFDHLASATLDFAQAIDAAAPSAGTSGLQKIQLDKEEGILAFQLEYFDLSKVYVDAVTGGIIPHHGQGDDFEETLPAASFNSCVAAAIASVGTGWVAFEGETEDESSSSASGVRVEVRFFNIKTSEAVQVTVALDGTVLSTTSYSPSSSQASRIASILAHLAELNVSMADAVTQALAAYEGAGVHEAELKYENGSLVWKVEIITALLVEIDVWVDASVAQPPLAATAAVNPMLGDLNDDLMVDGLDLAELFAMWGQVNPVLDFDGNGSMGSGDLTAVLSSWGQ